MRRSRNSLTIAEWIRSSPCPGRAPSRSPAGTPARDVVAPGERVRKAGLLAEVGRVVERPLFERACGIAGDLVDCGGDGLGVIDERGPGLEGTGGDSGEFVSNLVG